MVSFEVSGPRPADQLALLPNIASRSRSATPRPFLKWAGGKGQLLPALIAKIDSVPFQNYHEPFLGGGAVFFELARSGRLSGNIRLSDLNVNLITSYRGVRDHVDEVISHLLHHSGKHSEDYYYSLRASKPDSPAARAAWLIYLNKTCFNGLYRENSKGQFNVPFGRYDNPTICDEVNLRAGAEALAGVQLEVAPFEEVLDVAASGDFVYFDPPYDPLSVTSSFTSYSGEGFGPADQARLAGAFRELDRRGVRLMLSNSLTPLVTSLYGGFAVEHVLARRAVNSRGDRRGRIAEVIVTNFG